MLLIVFFGGRGFVLLIVACFESGIRIAHRFFSFGRRILIAHRFFFVLEGDPYCSCFFVLGGGSVLLIVYCFGRGVRVGDRFYWGEGDTCC